VVAITRASLIIGLHAADGVVDTRPRGDDETKYENVNRVASDARDKLLYRRPAQLRREVPAGMLRDGKYIRKRVIAAIR